MNTEPTPIWLRPRDAAIQLSVHPRTVINLIHAGQLDGVRIGAGRNWRVTQASLQRYIRRRQEDGRRNP